MNFFELIEARHSCRNFLSTPVEKEKMDVIYEAIRLAPTAGNLQAFGVREVTDLSQRGALAAAAWMQKFINDAPLSLVFFATPDRSASKYGDRGIDLYCIQDATIACTHAMLAATELGLASCWVGAFDSHIIKHIMRLEWSWKPIAILPIGYPDPNIKLTSPFKSHKVQIYDSSSTSWRSR